MKALVLRWTCWFWGGHQSTNPFASRRCDRCGLVRRPKPWRRS